MMRDCLMIMYCWSKCYCTIPLINHKEKATVYKSIMAIFPMLCFLQLHRMHRFLIIKHINYKDFPTNFH